MEKYLYDLRRILIVVIILLVLLNFIPFILGDNYIQIGVYNIWIVYIYLDIVLAILILLLLVIINAPIFMKIIGVIYTIFTLGGLIMVFFLFGMDSIIDISESTKEKIYIHDKSSRGDESFEVFYRNTIFTVKSTGIEYNNYDSCKSTYEWEDYDLIFSCSGQEIERYDIRKYTKN